MLSRYVVDGVGGRGWESGLDSVGGSGQDVVGGRTQGEATESLGRPQSFVAKYEGAERRLDVLELRRVCEALGISLGEFVRRLGESRS